MSIIEKKGKHGTTFQVNFRYKDHGVSKRYTKNFKSRVEAVNHETLMKAQLINGNTTIARSKITLDSVYNEFLQYGSQSYSENTIYDTKKYYESRIRSNLGMYPIVEIDYSLLQDFFNAFSDKGYESNKNMKKALNRLFVFAIKNDYIKSSPISFVDITGVKQDNLKKAKKKNNKVIAYKDFKRLIDAFDTAGYKKRSDRVRYDSYIIALYIGWFLGLRVSETLALNKNDFDLKNSVVVIDKQLLYKSRRIEEITTTKSLKTESSYSILPIPLELNEILLDWFNKDKESNKLCHDSNNNYISPDVLSLTMSKVINKIDDPNTLKGMTYHCLRHTLATRLTEAGINPTDIAFLMRHSSFDVTMENYVHQNTKRLFNIINSLN